MYYQFFFTIKTDLLNCRLRFHNLEKVAFYLFKKIFYVFMNVNPNFGKTLLTSNGIPVITVK